ncbi:MAG: hypothetical protein ACFB20_05755 [Opitutales bacterium]
MKPLYPLMLIACAALLQAGCVTTRNATKQEVSDPKPMTYKRLPGWGSDASSDALNASPQLAQASEKDRKATIKALGTAFESSVRAHLKRVNASSEREKKTLREAFTRGYTSIKTFDDLYRDMPSAERAWQADQNPNALDLALRQRWLHAFDEGAYEACLVLEEILYSGFKEGLRLRRQSLDVSGLNLRFHERKLLGLLMKVEYPEFALFQRDKSVATWVAYFPNGSHRNGLSDRFYQALYRRAVKADPTLQAYYGGPTGPRPRNFLGVHDAVQVLSMHELETKREVRLVTLERLTVTEGRLTGAYLEIRANGFSFWQPLRLSAPKKLAQSK